MQEGKDTMKTIEQIGIHPLKDHLIKNWMTHDAMWFYNVYQKYGIAAANELNKAAIKALAVFETQRAMQVLGIAHERITTFAGLMEYIDAAFLLSTAEFMGFNCHSPQANVLQWRFKNNNCFAYKGMRRLGLTGSYECGVIYRVLSWIDLVGIPYEVSPKIEGCLQHTMGCCTGEIRFFFHD